MMEGLRTGQPTGGGNLNPKIKILLAILGVVVGAARVYRATRERIDVPRKGNGRSGPRDDRLRVAPGEPTWRAAKDPTWEAIGEWAGWAEEFYQEHGRVPGIQDVYDRQWSLDFLEATGRSPSPEDWERHYYDPTYIGP
jgi:hypothetical protein